MTAPPQLPLPDALIDRLERLKSTSAGVLRDRVYEVLAAYGIDVERLVRDTRMEVVDEERARLERKLDRFKLFRARLASGRLPPEKAEEAKARLLAAPADIKAQRAVLKRLEERAPPPLPSAPTRELVRHMGREPVVRHREPNGDLLSAPRHEFEWPVDAMRVALTAEEYGAALRLREAYLRRQNTPGAVDWNGAGGSVPGSRLPIRDEQLRAGRDWNAVWLRLDPTLRLIVSNFMLEEPPRGRERCLTPVEFGQAYGALKDKATARGVAIGAVRTSCSVVARLFREYDQWRAEKRREGRESA